MNTRVFTLFSFLILSPAMLLAEVSDKMPSMGYYWKIALPVAFITFLFGFLRWRIGLALSVIPLYFFIDSLLFWTDPVYKAWYQEQGITPFINIYASTFLMLFFNFIGVYIGKKREFSLRRDGAA